MSRILQALKQLENRPQAAPAPPAAAAPTPPATPPATPDEIPSTRLPTMPFTPPAAGQHRPTERVAPRRKKQKEKAIRAAQREAKALANAAEVEQMLASLQPSLVECWTETDEQTHLIVATPVTDLPLNPAPAILQHDYLPAVVTIRERVEIPSGAPLAIQQPQVLESWSSAPPSMPVIVNDAHLEHDPAFATAVVVNEHLPEIIIQRELIERPPTVSRLPTVAAELSTLQAVAELRALLAASAPTVMESWSPELAPPTLIAAETATSDSLEVSEPVLVADYAPQVVTVREPAAVIAPPPAPAFAPPPSPQRMVTEIIRRDEDAFEESIGQRAASLSRAEMQSLLGESAPSVIECWASDDAPTASLVEEMTADLAGDLTSVIVASDGLPAELTFAAPPLSEPIAGPPEVELDFGGTTPRRREPRDQSRQEHRREPRRLAIASQPRRERRASPPAPQQERQLRAEVRRELAPRLPEATAWELNTRAILQQPALAAPYRQLVSRWQTEQRELDLSSLLVASLGEPALAADVVLPAALLLAAAHPEAKILLIEADDEAALARRLNLTGQIGLTDLLAPHDAHGAAIRPTSTSNVHVLTRGREAWPAQPPRHLASLLADLAREFAWILVAGGRIATPATQLLARECRGAYVIAPLGELSAPAARQQLDLLRNGGARVLGSMVVE